ncbi:MAG: hypothetical protein Fur006_62130 [Coleofasciculaceae cyanobacterium]
MQISYSQMPQPFKPVQPHTSTQSYAVGNTIACFLLLFLPSCLVLGAVLHKKYRAHRTAVLRRQIETLELMWRMSPKQ